MSHDKHTESLANQDLTGNMTYDYYLEMAEGWKDPLGPMKVSKYKLKARPGEAQEDRRVLNVIRDDIHELGTKGRWADLLVQRIEADTICYVAPRVGFAGLSLAALCKKYDKRLILFAPSSKAVSHHQAKCIEYGAEMRFFRIAAMPNLNRIAKEYADANGYQFFKLGLYHPLVIAAGVKVYRDFVENSGYGYPAAMWSVISTGVLTRSMQIAMPDTKFHAVAVARNIKEGERGNAELYSSPYAFSQKLKGKVPFPSIMSYDAKAMPFIREHAKNGDFFHNVASEPSPSSIDPKDIDSYRDWGDMRDFAL